MTLGGVLIKERERTGCSAAGMASLLKMTQQEYSQMESGESIAEKWGPLLAGIAIALEIPTSRLLSETGKAADIPGGRVGRLIARHRTHRNIPTAGLASSLGLSEEEYGDIEQDNSPIEEMGRRLLLFSEAVEQPIFNLFYPCGVPFGDLEDYP